MSANLVGFQPLKDFEARLPDRPYCSNYKSGGVVRPKAEAVRFPYIQINFPLIGYLAFDCDYHGAAIRPSEVDLPSPSLSIVTPDSGYAHLLYQLLDPIPRGHSPPTRRFLRDVTSAYKQALCADKVILAQRKRLIKNPLCGEWGVVKGGGPFLLGELAESIPDALRWQRQFESRTEPVKVKTFEETFDAALTLFSGNSTENRAIFEDARGYAYSIAHRHSSYRSLYNAVLEYIQKLNDVELPKYFGHGISFGELRRIARSIAAWTFDERGHFRQVKEGAMGLPSMKGTYWRPDHYQGEVTARRRLSAARTNKLRKDAAAEKILQGIEICRKRGIDPTAANIATLARVSRATVYRHKELIPEPGRKGL